MANQSNLEKFNEIYENTYQSVLHYVVCKCANLSDVNDIVQEVYIEVYKKIITKHKIKNTKAYVIGIAKHKIYQYYGYLYKFKTISLFSKEKNDIELIDKIVDETDIKQLVFNKCDLEAAWNYLKTKSSNIQKIFYLYYHAQLTIKEIAHTLSVKESYVKNCLYRTLNELKQLMEKESD